MGSSQGAIFKTKIDAGCQTSDNEASFPFRVERVRAAWTETTCAENACFHSTNVALRYGSAAAAK